METLDKWVVTSSLSAFLVIVVCMTIAGATAPQIGATGAGLGVFGLAYLCCRGMYEQL